MRALAVINRRATTTSERTRDVMLAALRHDLTLEVVETSHRGHAVELARQARRDQLDLVVAVGGDGTVNEVVNGLLDAGAGPVAPDLAVVPGGSTNVFARNLGLPEDPVEATGQLLDALRSDRRRPVGLGRLDERYFTFCAGIGFDADVVRAVEERRLRGRRSTIPLYVGAALNRFVAQRDRRHGPIVLETKGAEPVPGIVLAIVTNCSPWTYLGGRAINPSPWASFDRNLDVFALTRLGVVSTAKHLVELVWPGQHVPRGRDVVSLHNQAELTLHSSYPVPVQVDGDYLGERDHLHLCSVPDALHVAI